MSDIKDDDVDQARRKFLKCSLGIAGAIGLIAAGYPFLKALSPTEAIEAENGDVTVDISNLHAGEQLTVKWQGKPVWVIRRTAAEIAELARPNAALRDPNSTADQQPVFAQNYYRSLKPEILVLVGICTHLGCIPNFMPQPGSIGSGEGGFLCPCHGSRYDLSGRVFKDMPAPLNLVVPPYHFLDDQHLVIGS